MSQYVNSFDYSDDDKSEIEYDQIQTADQLFEEMEDDQVRWAANKTEELRLQKLKDARILSAAEHKRTEEIWIQYARCIEETRTKMVKQVLEEAKQECFSQCLTQVEDCFTQSSQQQIDEDDQPPSAIQKQHKELCSSSFVPQELVKLQDRSAVFLNKRKSCDEQIHFAQLKRKAVFNEMREYKKQLENILKDITAQLEEEEQDL